MHEQNRFFILSVGGCITGNMIQYVEYAVKAQTHLILSATIAVVPHLHSPNFWTSVFLHVKTETVKHFESITVLTSKDEGK